MTESFAPSLSRVLENDRQSTWGCALSAGMLAVSANSFLITLFDIDEGPGDAVASAAAAAAAAPAAPRTLIGHEHNIPALW